MSRILPIPPEQYNNPDYLLTHQFIGRAEQLDALDVWARSNIPIIVIESIGGMGKSALAWHWVRERAREVISPKGVVWWSFYRTEATVEEAVREMLAYIRMEEVQTSKSLSYDEVTQQLLHELNSQPFLIILDGIERRLTAYQGLDSVQQRDDEVNNQLRQFVEEKDSYFIEKLAEIQSSRILITTRLIPDSLTGLNIQHLQLGGLSDADARELMLLNGVDKRHANLKQMQDFTSQLGNHSLLLSITARMIEQEEKGNFNRWHRCNRRKLGLAISDFTENRLKLLGYALRRLSKEAEAFLSHIAIYRDAVDKAALEILNPYLPEMDEPELSALPTLYPNPLDAIGSTSIGTGEISDSPEKLQQIWLKMLDIRTDERAEHREHYQTSLAYKEALIKFDRMLQELQQRGLLMGNEAQSLFDMHPVIRGYAFDQLKAQSVETRTKIYSKVRDHFAALPPNELEKVNQLSDLSPNIEQYRATVRAGFIELALITLMDMSDTLYYRLGAYHEYIELAKALFDDDFEKNLGSELSQSVSYILHYTALSYLEIGEIDRSRTILKINMVHELDTDNINNIIPTLYTYATTSLRLNRLEEAGIYYRWSLTFAELIRNTDRILQIQSMLYHYTVILGRWDEAETYYEAIAKDIEKTKNRPWLNSANLALSHTHKAWMQNHEVVTECIETLDTRIQRLPKLQRLRHMIVADISLMKGDLERAETAWQDALRLSRQMGSSEAIPLALGTWWSALKTEIDRVEVVRLRKAALDAKSTPYDESMKHLYLAYAAQEIGDIETAIRDAEEAYRLAVMGKDKYSQWLPKQRAEQLLDLLQKPLPKPTIEQHMMDRLYQEELQQLEMALKSGSLDTSKGQPKRQDEVMVQYLRWLQVGVVASFGLGEEDQIQRYAEKIASLSFAPMPIVTSKMHEEVLSFSGDRSASIIRRWWHDIIFEPYEFLHRDKIFIIALYDCIDAEGNQIFVFANVRMDRFFDVLEAFDKGEPFNISDKTTLIIHGSGIPTQDEWEKLRRDYLFGVTQTNLRIFPVSPAQLNQNS